MAQTQLAKLEKDKEDWGKRLDNAQLSSLRLNDTIDGTIDVGNNDALQAYQTIAERVKDHESVIKIADLLSASTSCELSLTGDNTAVHILGRLFRHG
jgi:hypothetical protein